MDIFTKLWISYQNEQLSERIFFVLLNASLEGAIQITWEKFHARFFCWSKQTQTVPGLICVAEFWESHWGNFSNPTEVLHPVTWHNSSAFALTAFLQLAVTEVQSCIK